MKKLEYNPVPMPKKKITFKKGKNGTIYVYQTLRAYRNAKGNPTSDEAIIGKQCKETGMLIPNGRYFDLYPSESPVTTTPRRISDYGNTYALSALAEECGLLTILRTCFPDKWKEISCYASYMICEGNIMMYSDDWGESTQIIPGVTLSSQKSSELFSSISYEERMSFFEHWIKSRTDQEYLIYDVTSISTYSKGNDLSEWGYNHDNEKLKQINLGLFYGQESRLPVFYNVYNGSITDKSHLIFMMEHADSLGLEKVMFIMDRGFVTKDNLTYMHEEQLPFTVCLPSSRLDATKLIDESVPRIRKSSNWIAEHELYGVSMDHQIYDIPVKAHVFFSPEKNAKEEKSLFAYLERLENELGKIQRTKKLSKKYTDFFDVSTESSTSTLEYVKNDEKIDERLQRMGCIVFITTDLTCMPAQLMSNYQTRDMAEKSFDNLKNDLDFNRLKTHTNKTTDGKIFVGFLALILRSLLARKIKTCDKTSQFTIEKILIELKKIKLVTLHDDKNTLMPLTSTQKSILGALDIPLEEIYSSINNL